MSESTYRLVENKIVARKVDFVVVKGKSIGVPIYELVCLADLLSEKQKYFLDLFNQGMEFYSQRKWSRAIVCLEKARQFNPNDRPSEIIIGRCKNYVLNPPPENWSGVVTMREK